MKTMVKLVVLLATLLLLTGVSFADMCRCFEVTLTDIDNPENVIGPFLSLACIDWGTKTGEVFNEAPYGDDDLAFFPEPKLHTQWQVLVYGDGCVSYIKDHLTSLNGIKYCDIGPGMRFKVKGELINWGSCPWPS